MNTQDIEYACEKDLKAIEELERQLKAAVRRGEVWAAKMRKKARGGR